MNQQTTAHQIQQSDEGLAGLLEEITQAIDAGEPIDMAAYEDKYPQYAERLRRLVPALKVLDDIGLSALRSSSSSGSSRGPASHVQGTLGDFRILREIGRGGMGVVYEAEQILLGRRVALKVLPFASVLDERRLQRFQNEARAAASLKHPNIVQVYSVGCERAVHFYAMEYVEGQTLAEVIAGLRQGSGDRGQGSEGEGGMLSQRGALGEHAATADMPTPAAPVKACHPTPSPLHPVTPSPTHAAETLPLGLLSTEGSTRSPEFFRTVARLGIQAAEALEHAHGMGVVHRDIKPSNLMVESRLPSPLGRGAGGEGRGAEGPHLWITDFGLAMTQKDSNLTMTGDVLGTLRYMSPEQLLAKHGVLDHRTDIFSLGLTLYELITLQPAFPGDDRQGLIRQIAEDDPCPPRQCNSAIPGDLETIILKAIAKEPEVRYATAQGLADDLRRFVEDQPIRARRPSLATRAAKWSRRHWSLVWSAALLLVLASSGLGVSTLVIAQGRAREAVQRERAEENLRLALDALDRVYLRFANRQAEDYVRLAGQQDRQRQELSQEDRQFLEDVLGFYEQFVLTNRDEPRVRLATVEAYGRVGDIRQRLGMNDEADQACSKAVELAKQLVAEFPDVAEYPYRLACAYTARGRVDSRQGDLDKAIGDFSQALRECARQLDAQLGRAEAFSDRGDGHEKAEKYSQALRDYDQAISDSTIVIETDPNSAAAYRIRGDANLRSGSVGPRFHDGNRFQKAITDYEKAIRLDPGWIGSYFDCGCACVIVGQYDKAVAIVTEGLRRAKSPTAYAFETRGSAYMETGELDKAITDYSESIRINPKNALACNNRGVAYRQKGNPDKAIADLTEAIRLDPKFLNPYLCRGGIYQEKGDLDKAIANWTEGVRANPKSAPFHLNRGALYEATGQFRKALADLEKAVDLAPQSALTCNTLAWFLVTCPDSGLRAPHRAVEVAAQAVESSPKNPDYWNTLGVAQYRAGNWKGAVHALEKSAEFRSGGDARDWFFMAMADWQLGNKDRAREWYDRAVAWTEKNAPDDEELRRFRAEAAELLGVIGAPPTEKGNEEAEQAD